MHGRASLPPAPAACLSALGPSFAHSDPRWPIHPPSRVGKIVSLGALTTAEQWRNFVVLFVVVGVAILGWKTYSQVGAQLLLGSPASHNTAPGIRLAVLITFLCHPSRLLQSAKAIEERNRIRAQRELLSEEDDTGKSD